MYVKALETRMPPLLAQVLLVAAVAAGTTLAVERQSGSDSSVAAPQIQIINSTAECRANFPAYLRDFGFNPFSLEGHEDPRPIETDTPKALLDDILNATRKWVVDEGFDRCVSAVCACVLKVPGREYAVHVSDCEETPGLLDHRAAIVYLSDPDLRRIDVFKWYRHCEQSSDPKRSDAGGTTSNNALKLPVTSRACARAAPAA
jgi:hypothetical protein